MSAILDTKVILEFQKGKPQAVERVFKFYYPKLVDFAWKMVGTLDEAEDIAQVAFIKLYEIRDRFDAEINISAYLFMAIRNRSLNYLRNLKKWNEKQKEIAEEMQSDLLLTYEYEITDLLNKKIQAAIEGLPGECKRIFKLLYIEELSPSDVAEILKISTSAVYTQRTRALKYLRLNLGQNSLALAVILHILSTAHHHTKVVT